MVPPIKWSKHWAFTVVVFTMFTLICYYVIARCLLPDFNASLLLIIVVSSFYCVCFTLFKVRNVFTSDIIHIILACIVLRGTYAKLFQVRCSMSAFCFSSYLFSSFCFPVVILEGWLHFIGCLYISGPSPLSCLHVLVYCCVFHCLYIKVEIILCDLMKAHHGGRWRYMFNIECVLCDLIKAHHGGRWRYIFNIECVVSNLHWHLAAWPCWLQPLAVWPDCYSIDSYKWESLARV